MKKFFLVLLVLFTVSCIIFAGLLFMKKYVLPCSHPSFTKTIYSPSCTDEGRTVNKCTVCSYEYVSDVTPYAEHELSTLTTAPTCSKQGHTLYYCKCGYSFLSEFTPPTEHDLVCSVSAPSCTEQGYSEFRCEKCEYSFKTNFVEPLGHAFSKKTLLPTATRAGYTEYTCDCSYSYIGDHVYYSDILESAYTENTTILYKGIDVSRWNHEIDSASGEYLPLNWSVIKQSGFDLQQADGICLTVGVAAQFGFFVM